MKIYKFGGASVKDATNVQNVEKVLQATGYNNCFLVVSAMGKTTNALEDVVSAYRNKEDYLSLLNEIERFHINIAKELIPEIHPVFEQIIKLIAEVKTFLSLNKSPKYDFVYDQVISLGELLSTKIISAYLNFKGIENQWIDAREYIKTNNFYREGKVDWEKTEKNFKGLDEDKLYITQGFIGSDENNFTTTLGREGSDYTGAIIAYCLNADSLSIWKDVKGVLNADPRVFSNTQILKEISYEEAIELAYYGASVIHPKTLQPLQSKNIPLYVKCFEDPSLPGSVIKQGKRLDPLVPCYIVKKNQITLSISSKSFSFIDEEIIKDVYEKLSDNKIKVNLIQISAISLLLCIEDKFHNLEQLIEDLNQKYKVSTVTDCTLYTIRHAQKDSENIIPNHDKAIVRQAAINTLQLVVKEEK
ncbi:aspartate kinase [Ornithobacterium rhinotracheale]|uniref:aspartate kinase n=1 Tax=Ornithobacterium rhinotracheale TaxID=28251 RepID=UPI001FF329C9|nr:aspartate kinase [Ornithobacterium rhinotracheale]MCK0205844.1 aspartate kinase [Ornithobacterium rhinotracheale]